MKCCCCDSTLTDYESTRRHADTGEFLDLCGDCLTVIHSSSEVFIPTKDRTDLFGADDTFCSDGYEELDSI